MWHFGVAEWSCLKDRNKKKFSADHLQVIHKVPVTIKPQKFKVNLGSKNYAEIKLSIFDTHLLAPAGMKSLEKLRSGLLQQESEIARKRDRTYGRASEDRCQTVH